MDENLKQTPEAEEEQLSRSSIPNATAKVASRRRFTRNAIVGGAVIASLGNRMAWGTPGGGNSGQGDNNCVSAATWASFATASVGPADEGQSTLQKIDDYNDSVLRADREEVLYDGDGDGRYDRCAEECVPRELVKPKDLTTDSNGIDYGKHGVRICGQYPDT